MVAEKGFFGATKSEVNRFKNEVNEDIFGKGSTRKSTKKKSRKCKRR